jgi:hypothetical protein
MNLVISTEKAMSICHSRKIALILTSIVFTVQASDLPDKQGILKAMSKGDMEAIVKADQEQSSKLAKMAMARMRFDIVESTRLAKECQETEKNNKGVLYAACTLFEAGNERILGNEGKSASIIANLKRDAYDHIRKEVGDPNFVVDALEIQNLDAYTKFPQIEVAGEIKEGFIGYVLPDGMSDEVKAKAGKNGNMVSALTAINVEFNGKTSPFWISAGQDYTTIGRKFAEKIGVKFPAGDAGTTSSVTRLGVADSITIAGITLKNWPVYVANTDSNVLGIDVISRLKRVVFTKDGLQVGGPAFDCQVPLRLGSSLKGSILTLYHPVYLDNQPYLFKIKTMLWTSDATKVELRGGASATFRPANPAKVMVNTYEYRANGTKKTIIKVMEVSNVAATIDGKGMSLWYGYWPYSGDEGYYMGAGILSGHDLQLDFENGTSCIK